MKLMKDIVGIICLSISFLDQFFACSTLSSKEVSKP